MNDLIKTVREAVEKVDDGVWFAQEDCTNCKGNGFTLDYTDVGYERCECHCLIPENRMFIANAPEWLLQLCDHAEAQEREIERIEQERNRLILSLKSSYERTVYDLREAQAKEIERLTKRIAPDMSRITENEYLQLRLMITDYGVDYLVNVIKHIDYVSHIKGGDPNETT